MTLQLYYISPTFCSRQRPCASPGYSCVGSTIVPSIAGSKTFPPPSFPMETLDMRLTLSQVQLQQRAARDFLLTGLSNFLDIQNPPPPFPYQNRAKMAKLWKFNFQILIELLHLFLDVSVIFCNAKHQRLSILRQQSTLENISDCWLSTTEYSSD